MKAKSSYKRAGGSKILKDTCTVAEAAKLLGVAKQWIYQSLDEGRLVEVSTKGGKVRLVDTKSVQKYAEQREKAHAGDSS